jgi:fructose-1,6-bisphosphatase/inositol monophosphatase family enzyme
VISKVIGAELFYCEKNHGSYQNNRRLRVSKRNSSEPLLASEDIKNLAAENFLLRSYGCRTLEVAYFASARLDKAFFIKNNLEFIKPFSLLVLESGGSVKEEKNSFSVSN